MQEASANRDPESLLLEAIDAPWASQVSSQDPRFSDVLSSGNLSLFERLEELTAEPEDPPLAAIELARAVTSLKERLTKVERMPLEAALTDFVCRVTRARDVRLTAILRRLGCDGEPPATLEEAASYLGVTRERMRQIQSKFLERLPSHPVFMPQLDAAIAAIREAAPISVDGASKLLEDKGISSRPFHPKSVLSAAEFCRRSQTFEIDNSFAVARVIVEQRREAEKLTLSVACRQAQASGASNIQEVITELISKGQSGATDESARRLLKECGDLEFLNGDWFWYATGVPERNRLRNLTRKMLSVTSPISVDELRDGVHRYYKICRRTRGLSSWPLLTPPRVVLQELYRVHPEFTIDSNGLVTSVGQLDYHNELNPTERVLFDVIRSSPASLLDRSSLARSCADLGMNPNTFSQYLSGSPVIAHLGTDMWGLRGMRVDPAAVDALREANAARPAEKRIIDHGWTESGNLWLAARLPEDPSRFVLGIPLAIRRFVAGRDFSATDQNGLMAGTVRVNPEGTSYGYGPFLARRGADADDILLISFHLTHRSATLQLVDDEELEAMSPGT
jgi:hypothetical protein